MAEETKDIHVIMKETLERYKKECDRVKIREDDRVKTREYDRVKTA